MVEQKKKRKGKLPFVEVTIVSKDGTVLGEIGTDENGNPILEIDREEIIDERTRAAGNS